MLVLRLPHSHTLAVLLFVFAFLILPGCKVYTIDKSNLERGLQPDGNERFLSVRNISKKTFRNNIDTLWCIDRETGEVKLKHFTPDSKITIVTKKNRTIKYYARSLYIYKQQFLIGERTAPRFNGPNLYPVRLSDIERIEVNTLWF